MLFCFRVGDSVRVLSFSCVSQIFVYKFYGMGILDCFSRIKILSKQTQLRKGTTTHRKTNVSTVLTNRLFAILGHNKNEYLSINIFAPDLSGSQKYS
jgi:hypothetical protein